MVVAGDTAYIHFLHVRTLLDFGTRIAGKAGHDFQIDVVFLCHLDRAVVQDLRAQGGKFQHFVVSDGLQLARVRHKAGVCRVDAINVGINLAQVCAQGGRNGDCSRIRTAAAQRRDVVLLIDALEAGDNDNAVAVELRADTLGRDLADACLGIIDVGLDAGLPAGQRDDRIPELLNRHGQQRHRNLLACRQQDIHLTLGRTLIELGGLRDKVVGRIALRGHDHDHLIASLISRGHNVRHVLQPTGIGDRRAAKLLYDQTHFFFYPPSGPLLPKRRPGLTMQI